MKPVMLEDILDLREYERRRKDERRRLMEMKARRRIPVGDKVTLLFENRETVWYQVQEIVRAERLIDDAAVQDELDSYNALVPGANEIKATLFIEIDNDEELKKWLPRLPGIENSTYLEAGGEKYFAEGEEGRSREDYTSTVHYLTWRLDERSLDALYAASDVALGIAHQNYEERVILDKQLAGELVSEACQN